MIWQVSDEGRVEVRLKATEEQAIRVARASAERFIANVVGDLTATMSIDLVTDELRYSFSKTRPEVTVIWRAHVPLSAVSEVREYLMRLGASVGGIEGAHGAPDQ